MQCNGTTHVGHVDDGLGTIRYVFCDARRTIAVDAWDGHWKSWAFTYVDPKIREWAPELRREGLLRSRLRRAFG